MTGAISSPALEAYEHLAPFYDSFTSSHVSYERWLTILEGIALEHGLTGHRLLDVGCGTGKSFEPMLERGYQVTACDLSPAMVEVARRRLPPGHGGVVVADMRSLPDLGEFDLVTCIDDAINYLLEEGDLLAAFRGVARLLAPTGIYVFDTNSLATYRHAFVEQFAVEDPDVFFCWRGEGSADCAPGSVMSATVEVFARVGENQWRRRSSRHVQRHYGIETIKATLAAAGLRCLAAVGQTVGAQMHLRPDEDAHRKIVFVAGRA